MYSTRKEPSHFRWTVVAAHSRFHFKQKSQIYLLSSLGEIYLNTKVPLPINCGVILFVRCMFISFTVLIVCDYFFLYLIIFLFTLNVLFSFSLPFVWWGVVFWKKNRSRINERSFCNPQETMTAHLSLIYHLGGDANFRSFFFNRLRKIYKWPTPIVFL